MEPTETHYVPQLESPIRLQEYAVDIFKAIKTKSALKKALKKNLIRVNDNLGTTATYIIGGECISLSSQSFIGNANNPNIDLHVLYEDEHLAVIHKPAGILVSGNRLRTIANALPHSLNKSKLYDATQPQPVHRLDYPTTGLLLIGKTSSSIRTLNKIFENKEIKKTYYAVCIGKMDSGGVIDAEIGSKSATTIYNLIESVHSVRFGILNLVELNPLSGRRHQLRIHLSTIGNPILGDTEYGIDNLILKGKGLYLHAFSLKFHHPFSNKEVYIKYELPQKFNKIFS